MVAPNYAEHRSKLAKQLGLGRKSAAEDEDEEPEIAAAPKPAPAPAPEPVEIAEAPPPRRRAEHTAASVFAKFPAKQLDAPAENDEPATEAAIKAKRGRKPFSKQLARTMRQ